MLVPTPKFLRELAKLSEVEKDGVFHTLDILKLTPRYPSLRTKKYRNCNETSVNMDIRILWRFDDQKIVLLNVGHHDILRKHNKRKI